MVNADVEHRQLRNLPIAGRLGLIEFVTYSNIELAVLMYSCARHALGGGLKARAFGEETRGAFSIFPIETCHEPE